MEVEFGHGFIPRIGEDNYQAVDRCIGPADLFSSASLNLPWAIVDGAWAESKPDVLQALRANKTKMLVDTVGWRYRYAATGSVKKLAQASWAPKSAVSLADEGAGRGLIEASLRAQAGLDADAYLLPGWMPEQPEEDMRKAYDVIFSVAAELDDVAPRPFVAFVGGHTKGLSQLQLLLESVPHFVSAVYVQVSPLNPMSDGPSKLESVTGILQYASSLGFKVIAGHAGAVAPTMRALGIDAADCGLATSETFDRSRARREAERRDREPSQGGGRRSRMYFSQLGLSLGANQVETLLAVPAAAAELQGCRLPCHRFRSGHIIERAREHSLWARVEDAELVTSLPPSMRLDQVHERAQTRRSTIAAINGALSAASVKPLDVKPVDNHLAWISRSRERRSAA